MWKHIFCQAIYQLFWLFLIVYGATKYIAPYRVSVLLTVSNFSRLQTVSASLGTLTLMCSVSAATIRNSLFRSTS